MEIALERKSAMPGEHTSSVAETAIAGTIRIVSRDGRSALIDVTTPNSKFKSASLNDQTKGRGALLRDTGMLVVGTEIVGTAIEGIETWDMVTVQAR